MTGHNFHLKYLRKIKGYGNRWKTPILFTLIFRSRGMIPSTNLDLLGSLHGRSPQMHWLSSLSFLWWLWNAFLSPELRVYSRFGFQVGHSKLKSSLSSQWSLVRNFVRDFVCISFVRLTSLWEQSQTKLMQKKLHTRNHWIERLGLR